jgi:hypothetical protein
LFALLGLVGLFLLYAGLRVLVTGEREWGTGPRIVVTGDHWGVVVMSAAMGFIFAAIGVGYFYYVYLRRPLRHARRRALEARYPRQPWMLRRDWAARRVTGSGSGVVGMVIMWLWSVAWWSGLLLIGSVNRDQILAAVMISWGSAAFALIACLVGLAGLLIAVALTCAWRHDRSVLRIDTLPGRLGDRFRGTLEANFTKRPAALEAEITCERVRRVTKHRGGETSQELESETLWSATHALDTSRILLSEGARAAKLPLDLPLPADQPPCALDDKGEGIVWRLTVWEPGDYGSGGRDDVMPFSASFEVPVFGRC